MTGNLDARVARARSKGRGRGTKGQATIEFALLLPVLLILVFGILKAGMVYNNYITLTDAVRVGARQLTLGRGLNDPCTPAIARTISAAGPGVTLTAAQVTPSFEERDPPNTCGTPNGSGGYAGGNMVHGDWAKISATHPCDLVIFGINFLPGCTLKASATQAIE